LPAGKVIVPSCSSPSSGKLAATKGSSFLINGSVPTFYHALAGSCQSPAAFRPNRAPGQHAPRCVSAHADRQHHLAVRTTASFIQDTDHWRGAAASRGTHRAWRYAPITGSGRPQDCSLIYPPAHIEPWSATRQRARSRSAARGPAARRRTGPGLNHRPYTGPKPRVNQSGGDLRTPFLSSVFVRFGPERAWRRSEGRP
jgi:hypothetical protein